MDRETLTAVMENHIPFNRFLGIRAMQIEPHRVLLALPFRDELIGDPTRPALHGGVVSTLADVAGGAAVWNELEDPRARISTIDLRIDYLRPGNPLDLHAEAAILRIGRRVGVAEVLLFHPGRRSEPLAKGVAVYNIAIPKG